MKLHLEFALEYVNSFFVSVRGKRRNKNTKFY